jgi:ketosteroid isomerase-like protein
LDEAPTFSAARPSARSEEKIMRIWLARVLTVGVVMLALCFVTSVSKSAVSDLDQVEAANQAYYSALSARDLSAMQRVWAQGSSDVNVAPPIKPVANTGWDTIKKNYETFWATLDELTVSMAEPHVVIHGSVAWVYGIEQSKRKAKNGQVSGGPNFGTSIFVKEKDRWLMVFHQAALIPGPK